MKYKKDLPRKYRKYVRWGTVNENGGGLDIVYGRRDSAILHRDHFAKQAVTVQPVLCLPLSMIYHFHGCEADQNEMIQLERKSARCNTP